MRYVIFCNTKCSRLQVRDRGGHNDRKFKWAAVHLFGCVRSSAIHHHNATMILSPDHPATIKTANPINASIDPVASSNYLADLAARIRTEHATITEALRESVRHAIAAGEHLIEAKAHLQHGQWLLWLREHCAISDRTAQLYMRVARNREAIEANAQCLADLSLNEAAALLMISSDLRKLLDFTKGVDGLSGEELVDFCIANNVGVINDLNYDPFSGRSEAEKAEWLIFSMFLSCDGEWLGPEGTQWRRCVQGTGEPTEAFRRAWTDFYSAHRDLSFADIDAKMSALQARFESDRAKGIIKAPKKRRKPRGGAR